MHLLAAKPGAVTDGSEAVDLGQSPGDIVVLSSADTELACLSAARARLGDDFPSVRLASLLHLQHHYSVDLHVERVVAEARVVVIRLIGGEGYWQYGVEQVVATARERGVLTAFLPGDDKPDADLASRSSLPAETVERLRLFAVHGGIDNAEGLLRLAANVIGRDVEVPEPEPLPKAGLYWPGAAWPSLEDVRAAWPTGAPVVPIVFYRALVQAGNLAAVDALVEALAACGLAAMPVFVSSLKDQASAALLAELFEQAPPAVILNATGFAVGSPGGAATETPFTPADCPVLQVIFSGGDRDGWERGSQGLSARDIAMNVALPEVDGRLLTRAVSFKAEDRFDPVTECPIVAYAPVPDRIEFVADLAAGWARLRETPVAERRVALVLANYPNRDGRLGNGVGLDTPASTVAVLRALRDAGYGVRDVPISGDALMNRLSIGPTNAAGPRGHGRVRLSIDDYRAAFEALPAVARSALTGRWGAPEDDPFVEGGDFVLPILDLGRVVVAIQPARGYNIDPKATYHDPALVPPHGYLAFHFWLRRSFEARAVVHMGKHGNLEWLPGKALALSNECWPEIALGALPNLYPFIVNDPGEGSQAKRRAAAVVVDHLTPPLTRAESYGPLKELEALVDEYFEASTLDPRRLAPLGREILELAARVGLDQDCGITEADDDTARLSKLDAYLCELKEMQIRDGLHVFGASPEGRLETDLLTALVRVPRARGEGADGSLHRALAADLGLEGFDPLDAAMAAPWDGSRPGPLDAVDSESPWRTAGDTVERLELLAAALVSGGQSSDPAWTRTGDVLGRLNDMIRPSLRASGAAEMAGLMAGLDGRFVPPGPSGAPTRGRPEVLPTGRNFFSVDTRAVPTPAAWRLAWKSAGLLLDRHRQEHGDWPRAIAMSAWGTANMRTGGDDIAQAMALMGVRPDWDANSGRVVGFEIMPLSVLDRPRVDVTFRVSGFFRDAFPFQIDLLDSAVRAVAALEEPADANPLAARVAADRAALVADGLDEETAARRAGFRVFGSKPGAYGAGLQALIDERLWDGDGDFAEAYLGWGGYAYGAGAEGSAEHGLFRRRLGAVQAVVQNQDNREHDLLDSDDYYQFEGGLAATVRHLTGAQPAVWHMDHSRPESPKARALGEEIARVVRARAVNPKWIEGVKRHGYKGAFEMAATVDYLFAFAATARVVADHHFDAVHEAYLEDEDTRRFLERHNPAALREMAERLAEAIERGLWRPRSNSAGERLARLSAPPALVPRP